MYSQPGRFVLHIVNLTNEAAWRAPMDDVLEIGPITVKLNLPRVRTALMLVSGQRSPAGAIRIPRLGEHEVLVLE